jgi:hypothetical protein
MTCERVRSEGVELEKQEQLPPPPDELDCGMEAQNT